MARTYSFDALMELDDGASVHSASGFGQVGGVTQIIDLGGSPINTNFAVLMQIGALARIDAMCVVDVAAITDATGETATVSLMGSNNSNGSAPVNLATLLLGAGASLPNGSAGAASTGAGSTTSPGKFEMPFTNEQNGIVYEFVYIFVTIGSTASIQFNTVYIAPQALE